MTQSLTLTAENMLFSTMLLKLPDHISSIWSTLCLRSFGKDAKELSLELASWMKKKEWKIMKTIFNSKQAQNSTTVFHTCTPYNGNTIKHHNEDKKDIQEISLSQSSTFLCITEKHGFHFLIRKLDISIDQVSPWTKLTW